MAFGCGAVYGGGPLGPPLYDGLARPPFLSCGRGTVCDATTSCLQKVKGACSSQQPISPGACRHLFLSRMCAPFLIPFGLRLITVWYVIWLSLAFKWVPRCLWLRAFITTSNITVLVSVVMYSFSFMLAGCSVFSGNDTLSTDELMLCVSESLCFLVVLACSSRQQYACGHPLLAAHGQSGGGVLAAVRIRTRS